MSEDRTRALTPAPSRVLEATIYAQAGYFVVTGVWPFISMRAFERITGPKADRWLVKTVGALVTVIGVTLLAGRRRGDIGRETVLLATSSAVALGAIETWYVARRRISPVYLLDAVLEVVFIAGWVVGLRARQHEG